MHFICIYYSFSKASGAHVGVCPVHNHRVSGFEIVPIRVSETCQNLSGHVKCPCMVIRWTCPFFATCKVLLELQETPQADIDQHNVSLAGVLQVAARCSWSRSRYPSVRAVVGR